MHGERRGTKRNARSLQHTSRVSGSPMQFTYATSGGGFPQPLAAASSARSVSDFPVPGTPLTYMLPGLPVCSLFLQ